MEKAAKILLTDLPLTNPILDTRSHPRRRFLSDEVLGLGGHVLGHECSTGVLENQGVRNSYLEWVVTSPPVK